MYIYRYKRPRPESRPTLSTLNKSEMEIRYKWRAKWDYISFGQLVVYKTYSNEEPGTKALLLPVQAQTLNTV